MTRKAVYLSRAQTPGAPGLRNFTLWLGRTPVRMPILRWGAHGAFYKESRGKMTGEARRHPVTPTVKASWDSVISLPVARLPEHLRIC